MAKYPADALKQLESGQRPSEADLDAIARDYKLDRAFLGELCDRLLS